jgi:hypothetical protein
MNMYKQKPTAGALKQNVHEIKDIFVYTGDGGQLAYPLPNENQS